MLPDNDFKYTIDQIAYLLSVSEAWLKRHITFSGRIGVRDVGTSRRKLKAFNLAEPDETPQWRISEREFVRWCGVHGARVKRTTRNKNLRAE